MAGGHGGHARIHAARARKYKAQLDRVREALVLADFPVADEDEEGVVKAVEFLSAKVREQQRKLDDIEWERAGSAPIIHEHTQGRS